MHASQIVDLGQAACVLFAQAHLFLLSSQYSSRNHPPIYRDAALLNKHGDLLNRVRPPDK